MQYMQKKGEQFPIPYDEALYDATIYELIDPAESAKPKAKKAKVEKVAPVADLLGDIDDEDFGLA
jgi:hypothetical protein